MCGSPLLNEAQQRIEDEDCHNHRCVERVSNQQREHGCHCEDCDQNVRELAREEDRPPHAFGNGQRVGAVLRGAAIDFGAGQSARGIDVQLRENRIGRARVSVTGFE